MSIEAVDADSRPPLDAFLQNEEILAQLTGLEGKWIVRAVESTYETLDLIDGQLRGKGTPPLSQIVELANLSSMIGNLLGAGLAEASDGKYERNRPHAYPDLLPLEPGVVPAEVKMALETNRPKGHLPKPGFHLTFRYVLGSSAGEFVRGTKNRGATVWIWEGRIGHLLEQDYDQSNTEGDSGKTATIKTEVFKHMPRVFYVPELCPYARRTGQWGDNPPEPRV